MMYRKDCKSTKNKAKILPWDNKKILLLRRLDNVKEARLCEATDLARAVPKHNTASSNAQP